MGVTLVGAGPGSVELLTLAAAEALRTAEVVVHDRLVDPTIFEIINPEAELIDVGKKPGTSHSQALINDLLVTLGVSGRHVVRLKGGDPFVFGRGAEEVIALREAGIEVRVIPGLSSALVAPLVADIPVTHRTLARGVLVVTGHTVTGDSGDFARLAVHGVTLVILMGVEHRGEIAGQLISGGLDPHTPCAVIERACRDDQRVTRGVVHHLGEYDVAAPAVIVIGDVVSVLASPIDTLLTGSAL